MPPPAHQSSRERQWSPRHLQRLFPAWSASLAAYLAEGRSEGAFWRGSVPGWAFLLTAVQLNQIAALRVAGEFTVWRERTTGGMRGQSSQRKMLGESI